MSKKEIKNKKILNKNNNAINNKNEGKTKNNNLLNNIEKQKEKYSTEDFSIDINIISEDRVEIKIPLINDKNKILIFIY